MTHDLPPALPRSRANVQYFARAYPDSLISLSGSSSDEVLVAAGLRPPSAHYTHLSNVPDNLSAVDQLWPQLTKLVEPFGLRKRSPPLGKEDVSEVRREADDLSDPADLERDAVKH